MKKRGIALLLTALMLLGLTACGGQKDPTGGTKAPTGADARKAANEINVGIAQDLSSSLGPYQLATAGTREVMFNVFEGLYKVDPSGDFKPALATDHTVSADGLVYSFTIREGVKYHNGAVMTAQDVIHSFKTCAESSVDSSIKKILANVKDLKEESGKVVMTLEKPDSDFLAYVSSVYISPAAYTEQDTKPVGTGLFKFVSRTVQDSVVLERSDVYWGEKAGLNRITFKIFENITAMMTALEAGSLDLACHLDTTQVKGLSKEYNVLEGSMNLVQALYLNHEYAPLKDIRVRQALNYAVDVDAMLKLTAEGHGHKLGSSIYPAFKKYFDESLVNAYPYNPEKAKSLLAEAGYANGFKLTITVPSNYTPHVNTGMVLAEQLKAVGIDAGVQEVEWNTWLTDVYQGHKFEATVCGFDASTLTANALLGRYESTSSKNMCSYKGTQFDAFLKEALATTDDARRTELFKSAAKCLSDDAVNVYLQDLAEYVAIRSTLKGFTFYPLYVLDLSKVTY